MKPEDAKSLEHQAAAEVQMHLARIAAIDAQVADLTEERRQHHERALQLDGRAAAMRDVARALAQATAAPAAPAAPVVDPEPAAAPPVKRAGKKRGA